MMKKYMIQTRTKIIHILYQYVIIKINDEVLKDFSLDLDLFLDEENILNDNDTAGLAVDNPPNILNFNFEKVGCSPEKYKMTRFKSKFKNICRHFGQKFQQHKLYKLFQQTRKSSTFNNVDK